MLILALSSSFFQVLKALFLLNLKPGTLVYIGEGEELQLFYYFIKSENNPEEDPLLIWLTGGPECSSLTGLLFQSGPLALKLEKYNGSFPSLFSTTYSWTKVAENGKYNILRSACWSWLLLLKNSTNLVTRVKLRYSKNFFKS